MSDRERQLCKVHNTVNPLMLDGEEENLDDLRGRFFAGVVENAVLLGAPVSIRQERWRMAGASVSGRFINGYSRNDWVLGIVYRGGSGTLYAV